LTKKQNKAPMPRGCAQSAGAKAAVLLHLQKNKSEKGAETWPVV
jgi:hypothetical protein